MEHATDSSSGRGPPLFPSQGVSRLLLLGGLLVAALVLRLQGIGNEPMDFHPTRQYHAAQMARSVYMHENLLKTKTQLLEPPLMECLAAGLYSILGHESLTSIRIVSVLWWMLAAVFLYLLVERAVSSDAGVLAAAYFLFIPYGVLASRSFQPDPLMILLFVASVWSFFRLRETPSRRWLATATALSAFAIFVKPVCVFPLWLAFLFSGLYQNGIRATISDVSTWFYFVLGAIPAAAYYGSCYFLVNDMRSQASGSFQPHFLLERFYWHGWWHMILYVVGQWTFFAALASLVLARTRLTRGLLVGLWSGYLVYGLVFTFHIHTHDYYQLPLIPIVAISLGVVAGRLLDRLLTTTDTTQLGRQYNSHPKAGLFRRLAVLQWLGKGVVYGVLALAIATVVYELSPTLRNDCGGNAHATICSEIGDLVAHGENNLYLAPAYGESLMYHGRVTGERWPYSYEVGDLSLQEIEHRLNYLIVKHRPAYFIVAGKYDFQQQPNLERALAKYPLIYSTEGGRVYDLGLRNAACR